MNNRLIKYLMIGGIIGLILAYLIFKLTLPLFSGSHYFYHEDWFQIGATLLGFIIPILISYWLYKKN